MTWQGILVGVAIWMTVCAILNFIDMEQYIREYMAMGIWTPICWVVVIIVGGSIRLYMECNTLIRKTIRKHKERSE